MPARATGPASGIKIEAMVVNNQSEVTSASPTSQGLEHKIRVRWRRRRRGDVRITSKIISGAGTIARLGNANPPSSSQSTQWVAEIKRIIHGGWREEPCPFIMCGRKGTVVLDSGRLQIFDNWTGKWVTEQVTAQLTISVS